MVCACLGSLAPYIRQMTRGRAPRSNEVWLAGPKGKPNSRFVSRCFPKATPPIVLYREVGKLKWIKISLQGWLEWVRRTEAVLATERLDLHPRRERERPVESVEEEGAE